MYYESNVDELTEEEERLKRIWKRALAEIRRINDAYSNPSYAEIQTKTLAGKAYYNALLQYAHTTKFAVLPELYETELYEVYEPVYKCGGKKMERQFYFLIMRKFFSAIQDKDSIKSKELAKRDPRARVVIHKRYFEEKAYSTIEYEMGITSTTAKKLCEIGMQVIRSNPIKY